MRVGDTAILNATVRKLLPDTTMAACQIAGFKHANVLIDVGKKAKVGDRLTIRAEIQRVDEETITVDYEGYVMTVDAAFVAAVAPGPERSRPYDRPD